jgi:hypothetical protein
LALGFWIGLRALARRGWLKDSLILALIIFFGPIVHILVNHDRMTSLRFRANDERLQALLKFQYYWLVLGICISILLLPSHWLIAIPMGLTVLITPLPLRSQLEMLAACFQVPSTIITSGAYKRSVDTFSVDKIFVDLRREINHYILVLLSLPFLIILLFMLFHVQVFQPLEFIYHIPAGALQSTILPLDGLRLLLGTVYATLLLLPAVAGVIRLAIGSTLSRPQHPLVSLSITLLACAPLPLLASAALISRQIADGVDLYTRVALASSGGMLITLLIAYLILQYAATLYRTGPLFNQFLSRAAIMAVLLVLLCPPFLLPLFVSGSIALVFGWLLLATLIVSQSWQS